MDFVRRLQLTNEARGREETKPKSCLSYSSYPVGLAELSLSMGVAFGGKAKGSSAVCHIAVPLSLSLFNRQELESRKSSGVNSAVKLLTWPLFQSSIMTPIFGRYCLPQNLQYQRRRVALMSSCVSQASLSITRAHFVVHLIGHTHLEHGAPYCYR